MSSRAGICAILPEYRQLYPVMRNYMPLCANKPSYAQLNPGIRTYLTLNATKPRKKEICLSDTRLVASQSVTPSTNKMRKYPIVEIEDVSEPFCGKRRKNMIPLRDAEPEIAEEWVYEKNAGWGPEDFSKGSGVKCWWRCRLCHRDYKSQISNRTSAINRSACPYCASKLVCDENALHTLFPAVAAEWHPTKIKLHK